MTVNDASKQQNLAAVPDAQAEPLSLGAVSLDRGAYAETVAGLPAARRQANEESAALPYVEPPAHRVALRFKLIVGVAVAACFTILILAAMRTVLTEPGTLPATQANRAALVATAPVPAPLPPAVTPPPPPVPSPPALALPAPVTAPEPAPAPVTSHATIRLARAGQPLTVDGKRSKASSVTVACGAHTVAVGKEKPRHVQAPCGRTLVVDVGKTTLAKSDGHPREGKAHVAAPKRI